MTSNMKMLAASMAVALSSGSLLSTAFADDIYNKVDASVDASLETVNLVKGGSDAVVTFGVNAKDLDGVAGCNLTSSASLVVNVASSNTAVATVSPATLTFTNCTDLKTVNVKPVGTGQAEITLTQTANGSAGSFALSGASFTAIVADFTVDTTPPVITYALSSAPNTAGWNKGAVSVTWTVSDPESAILSKTGCDAYTQTNDTRNKTLVCTATSAGGTSTKSVTFKVDSVGPVIRLASPKANAEYDLNQRVKAVWTAYDSRSGVETSTGTLKSGSMIDTSKAGTFTFTVTATDKAGNVSTVTRTYTVKAAGDNDEDNDTDNDHGSGPGNDNDHGSGHEHQQGGQSKVTVCHKGSHSITIGAPAVKAHLKHGSTLGDCDDSDND